MSVVGQRKGRAPLGAQREAPGPEACQDRNREGGSPASDSPAGITSLPRLPSLRLPSCNRSWAFLSFPTAELPPRHLFSRVATSDAQNRSGDTAFESGLTAGGAPKRWGCGGDPCRVWEQVQAHCRTHQVQGSVFCAPRGRRSTDQVQGPGVRKQTSSFNEFSVLKILESKCTLKAGEGPSERGIRGKP